MNILVTGGAGFIGSHLVAALVADGNRVTVLDNLSTGNLSNLTPVSKQISFIEGDILNAELVESEVRRADLVYHLAAAVGVGNIMANPLAGPRMANLLAQYVTLYRGGYIPEDAVRREAFVPAAYQALVVREARRTRKKALSEGTAPATVRAK